jgi:lysozyme
MKAIICSSLLLTACVADVSGNQTTSTDTQSPSKTPSVTQICGSGPTVPGVDVSTYDGAVDWNSVLADGYVYAFVRVSDGLDFPDDQFDANWAGTSAAGVVHGAYQYFEPDQDPIQQADMVLAKIGTLQANDLPPAIDVETTDGMDPDDVHTAVQAWIDHVAAAIGRPPIVYVGAYFWDDDVGGADDTSSPLWHAQYTSASCPTIADPWTTWAFWQWSDTGSVDGIGDQSDVNRWNGDMASFTAFLGPGGTCGDGVCSTGETPISCPEDCGPCGTVDPQSGFVIDNGDACFQDGGPAAYLRSVTDAGYNDNLVWTHTTDDATEANNATWNFYFTSAGHYKIEAYTAASYAQSKQANYVITGATTQSVVLDQTAADGWQTIGEFDFNKGGHQSIHLGDNTGEASSGNVQLVFDGIRITPAADGGGSGGSAASGPVNGVPDGTSDSPPAGSSGCNASGGSSSALLGLALVGLVRRRRR